MLYAVNENIKKKKKKKGIKPFGFKRAVRSNQTKLKLAKRAQPTPRVQGQCLAIFWQNNGRSDGPIGQREKTIVAGNFA